ncbi:UNVERIFIED_CONTAM: hypothetical protein FKN15_045728 [Acipenser sinensis]
MPASLHQYICIDEAFLNFSRRHRWGQNIMGQRATVDMPGYHGGNGTLCTDIIVKGMALCALTSSWREWQSVC